MFKLMSAPSVYYKFIGIVVIVLGLIFWHTTETKLKVQAAQSAVRLELVQQYNKQTTELTAQSTKVQTELQAKVTTQQKEHNAKVHNLNLRITDLSNSLSDRPKRPSSDGNLPGGTQDGTSAKGATGAGLYQDDGAFLVRYAGYTEELKLNLLMCYKQYDTAKETLDKFKLDNAKK